MLAVALVAVVSAVAQTALTDYVEPRVGTAHCRWFHFAPGAMPFGMAKPGPSTNGHLGNKWGVGSHGLRLPRHYHRRISLPARVSGRRNRAHAYPW